MSPISGISDVLKTPDDTAAGASSLPNARFLMSPLIQDTFGRTVASTNYSTAVQGAVAPISPTSQSQPIYYGTNGQATNTAFSVDAAELVITGTGATQFADFYTPCNLAGPGVAFSLAARVQVSALGPLGVNGPNFSFKIQDAAGGLTAFASFQVTFNNSAGSTQLYLFDYVGGSATGNYGTMTANAQVGAAWWNILWTYANSLFSLTVWPVTSAQPSPQLTLAGDYGTGATQLHFGGNPRDCTNWMDYWSLTPSISVPTATPVTVGLGTTDWNTVTGLSLQGDGTVGFASTATGKYWTTGFAGFANASVPAAVGLLVNNTDPKDVVSETADRASTANANLTQTGLPLGAHAFGVGDSLAMQVTQYSGSTQRLVSASLGMVKIGQYTAPARPNNFLIAFTTGYNGGMGDASTHPWTLLSGQTQFAYPVSNPGCGAGPPQNQFFGVWARQIVPGESAAVMSNSVGGSTSSGMFVVEIGGCDFSSLALIGPTFTVVPSGADSVVSAVSGSTKIGVVGCTLFAKVDYDGGWCTGWPVTGNVVNQKTGVQLFNASAANGCAGTPPWVYVGAASGGGTVTTACHADSHGGGSGAYNCGWAVVQVGLKMNVVTKFSIVQSAGAGFGPPGGTVSLPNPPSL